ncbi:MAG: hypothetical protein CM15mP128_2230 [Methanobacteriota archaeon]|nr:MAG: hypothetical protein CM15mP128_2230 [Euryarchaeota archaeon]
MSDEPIRVEKWRGSAAGRGSRVRSPQRGGSSDLLPRDVPVSIGKDAHGARPNYSIGDAVAQGRAGGFVFPWGFVVWHAGKRGPSKRVAPRITERNMASITAQIKRMGFCTIGTAWWPRPNYYRWNQWFFFIPNKVGSPSAPSTVRNPAPPGQRA